MSVRPAPLLLIEQQPIAPSGHVRDWLAARDIAFERVVPSAGQEVPDPARYHGVVALGSQRSAYDDHVPWVRQELRRLHSALEADVPVLGICFGAQALARTLGAAVTRGEKPEIGWLDVESLRPDLVPGGPWFTWHSDVFALPDGATLLARNDHSAQAFAHGRHLGVQFHPEVTPAIIDGWLSLAQRQGVLGDVDDERRRTPELYVRARPNAFRLFDAWYDGLPPMPVKT